MTTPTWRGTIGHHNHKESERLVIARRINETLKISDDITIEIVAVSGNQVKIGIDAPKEVPILRDDVKKALPGDEVVALDS